ncbi:MAG: hypothetical protein ABSA04_07495 [Desulfobaccales bacterium]|jgi:hypothetical protein
MTVARSKWPEAPLEFKTDDGQAVGLLLAALALEDAHRGTDRAGLQARAREKKVAKRRQARANRKLGQGLDTW